MRSRKSFRAPAVTVAIRDRKPKKKVKPANEVSEDEINALFAAIQGFDGYPRLRDLRKMAPFLTPLQINTIIKYLERSGAIIIDSESYIVWTRKGKEDGPILGEMANMSSEFRDYLKDIE